MIQSRLMVGTFPAKKWLKRFWGNWETLDIVKQYCCVLHIQQPIPFVNKCRYPSSLFIIVGTPRPYSLLRLWERLYCCRPLCLSTCIWLGGKPATSFPPKRNCQIHHAPFAKHTSTTSVSWKICVQSDSSNAHDVTDSAQTLPLICGDAQIQ